MKRIYFLFTVLFMLVCFKSYAQSDYEVFEKLTDISQLNQGKKFIIVTEQHDKCYAMSIRRSDCERGGELVTKNSDGDIIIPKSMLDGSTVINSAIAYQSPRKVCLMRAYGVDKKSSTSVEAYIRMANIDCYMHNDAALTFCAPSKATWTDGITVKTMYKWKISTNAYNDGLEQNLVNIPSQGVFIKTTKTYDYKYVCGFPVMEQFQISSELDYMEEMGHFNGSNDFPTMATDFYSMGTYIYMIKSDVCEHDNYYYSPGYGATCMGEGEKDRYVCPDCGMIAYDQAFTQIVEDESELIIPKKDHTMEVRDREEPTCTLEGREQYYYCTECRNFFYDEKGTQIITDFGTIAIPTVSHTLEHINATEPSCTEVGHADVWHCTVCGYYFEDEMGGREHRDVTDFTTTPAYGHDYQENGVCSRCGNGANTYYRAYTYDKIVNDGYCLLVTEYNGKLYTVGQRMVIGTLPIIGGRGENNNHGFYAYEAIEVQPNAEGGIVATNQTHEIMRVRMNSTEYRDQFGHREGYSAMPPYGLFLGFKEGYARFNRTVDFEWSWEKSTFGGIEVFEKGAYGSSYNDERNPGCPKYTSLYQFEAGRENSLMRFKEINGKLYFTCRPYYMADEDAYFGIEHGKDFPYYTYIPEREEQPLEPLNPIYNMDIDGDGIITQNDINNSVNIILNMTVDDKNNPLVMTLDADGDGELTVVDIALGINQMLQGNQGTTDFEAVDLGLSVMWSTTNLGATKSTDVGQYYAWGETMPKIKSYVWDSYKYYDKDTNAMTKYTCYNTTDKVDDLCTLLPEDDAATAARGQEWRIPTEEEMLELKDNCIWFYREGYMGTETNGYEVWRAKTDSDCGKVIKPEGREVPEGRYADEEPHIFLPMTGVLGDGEEERGYSYGAYWTSTLSDIEGRDMKSCNANAMTISVGNVFDNKYKRCYGLCIRPVKQKRGR